MRDIKKQLENVGYYADDKTAAAVAVMLHCNKPLLIEGAPGVGKTFLAKAVAKMLGKKLIRLQMYEGLTDDKILYDYDYPRQLLSLEAVKPKLEEEYKNLSAKEMIAAVSKDLDFYGPEFLINRPILKSIDGSAPVLLIDEIDKAPEEVEYMLYEFLEDYSITVPQYGEITCPEDSRPIVFLTSNNYRELSDALKRRCNYLYIEKKDKDAIRNILALTASIDNELAASIAQFSVSLDTNVRKMPSLAELIEWAKYIKETGDSDIDIAMSILVNFPASKESGLAKGPLTQ